MRAQPGTQQRPEALDGVDVNLVEAIAIVVASILPVGVIDCFVVKAPLRHAGVDGILIGVDEGAGSNSGFNDRLDGGTYVLFNCYISKVIRSHRS